MLVLLQVCKPAACQLQGLAELPQTSPEASCIALQASCCGARSRICSAWPPCQPPALAAGTASCAALPQRLPKSLALMQLQSLLQLARLLAIQRLAAEVSLRRRCRRACAARCRR